MSSQELIVSLYQSSLSTIQAIAIAYVAYRYGQNGGK